MNLSQRSRISMIFITGQNEKGGNTTRTKTLNNVKGTAADEDLVQLITTLAALQQYPLDNATRNNNYSLM